MKGNSTVMSGNELAKSEGDNGLIVFGDLSSSSLYFPPEPGYNSHEAFQSLESADSKT